MKTATQNTRMKQEANQETKDNNPEKQQTQICNPTNPNPSIQTTAKALGSGSEGSDNHCHHRWWPDLNFHGHHLLSELPWSSLWVWVYSKSLIWFGERKKKEEWEHD